MSKRADTKWPFFKRRWHYQSSLSADSGRNFWRRSAAIAFMNEIAVYINRCNQKDALLGIKNYSVKYSVIDRATGETIDSAKAQAWKPVSVDKAHQNLVRSLGYA